MFKRTLWQKILFILVAVVTCVVFWQIHLIPQPPASVQFMNIVYPLYTWKSSGFLYPIHLLPVTDYHQLININFNFSLLNLVCNESDLLLVVLVHSSPQNIEKRNVIRDTWGKNDDSVRVLFMLGAVNSSDLQNNLEDENRRHNDFIQGNFLDTYRNVTYKHVMVFKYVIYHCPQAKYILKTDDDVFVNMPAMKILLTVDLSPYGAEKVLFCTIRKDVRVLRTYRSKWRVSFSEYPNRFYPTFCPGWNILYSPDVLFHLYKEAQRSQEYFWIDDIHITGTLAEKVAVSHTDTQPLVIGEKDFHNIAIVNHSSYNYSKPFLYGRPNMGTEHTRILWKYVIMHLPPKSVLKEAGLLH